VVHSVIHTHLTIVRHSNVRLFSRHNFHRAGTKTVNLIIVRVRFHGSKLPFLNVDKTPTEIVLSEYNKMQWD
jgi:hypothetical protein